MHKSDTRTKGIPLTLMLRAFAEVYKTDSQCALFVFECATFLPVFPQVRPPLCYLC